MQLNSLADLWHYTAGRLSYRFHSLLGETQTSFIDEVDSVHKVMYGHEVEPILSRTYRQFKPHPPHLLYTLLSLPHKLISGFGSAQAAVIVPITAARPIMLKLGSSSTLRLSVRAFSTTTCRPTVTETIDSIANKFKEAVRHAHSEEYEGVTEHGLRMLVFGKPGSGKVSRCVQSIGVPGD